ncbi:MAG: hypothetical protein PHV02_01645 [Rhodocyclaceae bacterium]|nr:hypothetical protein [Rhodocyclaceae bacterium]
MKKNQVKTAKIAILGYSAAMAISGSMISVDAIAGCTNGTASGPVTCGYVTGAAAPWAEAWSFTGSNNVAMDSVENLTGYAACAYQKDGTKSFGLTLSGGSMTIRDATGKSGNITSGCGA